VGAKQLALVKKAAIEMLGLARAGGQAFSGRAVVFGD
jgi:hypothetical protein